MTSLAHFEAVAGSLKLPGQAVIDGKLTASASGKTFANVTPRNGRIQFAMISPSVEATAVTNVPHDTSTITTAQVQCLSSESDVNSNVM